MDDERVRRPTENELFSWSEEDEWRRKEEGAPSERPQCAAESCSDISKNEIVEGLRKPRSRKNKKNNTGKLGFKGTQIFELW